MNGEAPLATVEVRWFFGRDDLRYEPVRRWFLHSAPDPSPWSERTDVYLLIPGAHDMGVKQREGQLQIKGRVASLGAQSLGSGHAGVVERWLKWSYAGLPAAYRALFETGDDRDLVTVPVRKRRALRSLRLDAQTGVVTEAPVDESPARGLGFEFTELHVRGRAYGTLGVEAYPDDAATRQVFAPAAAMLLHGLDAVRLSAAESMSYPAWLTTL